ncbi:hypothetical protein AYJ08_05795 [Brevibacillus sp. SKDU10]|uniref:helix-turn-helix transcriptional regulator n=1 Tax=Brevibacillus sp. SKDU10 TaxID=1247872 RepID=UPI0007C8F02E|nr:helix-turn-helix transcriptional regulator [Brevibacillus sp. SKDU10]OAJ75129.1 hypothetical protein AYJ08_05795 [Brevibacillus sp. SKDU10]
MPFVAGRCLLKQRLKSVRMTQRDLASRAGMPEQQISDYVNGRIKMSLDNARTLSHILQCSIEDLYEWEQIAPSQRSRSKHLKE